MSISFDYAPAPESRSIVDIQPSYGLFIGGGIHGHAMSQGDAFLASAQKVLDADAVSAKWAMPELGW